MIYLDNAATTYPKPDEVYDYLDYLNRNYSYNAGRGSYRKAQEVDNLIEETRKTVSNVVNAETTIFSSSATFALNQIIFGLDLNEFSNVYYSPYEHNAVMRTLHQRSKEIGFKMIEIPLNSDTLAIDLAKLNYIFVKEKPSAVFCTHVSNVTGYILPIEEIGIMCNNFDSIFIVDAAQSFAMIPIDMKKMNIDYTVFAGHKSLYTTFGVGGFCCNTKNKLNTHFIGGTGTDSLNLEMPVKSNLSFEPSSPNAIAIISLIKSIEWLRERFELIENEKTVYNYLISILKEIPKVKIYLNDSNDYFGVISINVEGYSAEDVGTILDEEYDICVRTGYHCAPNIHKYLNDEHHLGTIRIGLSVFTSMRDIDTLIKCLKEL